ncbi:hypothetical protein HMPREF0864_02161 [Enterobacteriaceae bacterium 9_2_54FAA]|nr:hypothetical protein HMPREF0864_02161 [Enterobacteriaceae bacterium 9_2_54FAA]
MSLYETGTITGALNSTTISGTGTKWSDPKIGITNGSVLFVSSSAGMDGVYQVKRVINDTSIELAQPIYKAFTHSKYSILVAEASSTASFANQLAAALGYYQAQIDGWQQIMTGTGDIVLNAPDGTKVTIKSFTKMSQDIDKKQDKSKILTDISNSKDADGVREYLGLKEALIKGDFGAGGDAPHVSVIQTQFDSGIYAYWGDNSDINYGYKYGVVFNAVYAAATYKRTFQIFIDSTLGITARHYNQNTGNESSVVLYTTGNTTKASDGTLKAASPIVKIFSDGAFETNAESLGVNVHREGVGAYRITNVLGMNSDGTWGGVDGGFDVPKDRNGQRLIWLDYEVEADGSILVKTYHRTYPDAPVFARNIKEGYEEGDLIDIPSDQFVSVRVEMPQDSIWNLAQKAAQEEMKQEKTTEE